MKPKIKGHCNHCGKETIMDNGDAWEVRWDLWASQLMRLGNAGTLCNKCCVKFHTEFMNRS